MIEFLGGGNEIYTKGFTSVRDTSLFLCCNFSLLYMLTVLVIDTQEHDDACNSE